MYPDEGTVIRSPKLWLSLPPTPSLPPSNGGEYADLNNIHLWYNVFGNSVSTHSPVVFLHGGLGNSDYFGHQIAALEKEYKIIAIDSRGHGRSTTDPERPLGYDLMSKDFLSLMDHLGVPKASFVGWSDGAICALNLASKHPERVDKVFAYAANYNTSGVMDVSKSLVFMTYINRTVSEYARISPTPDQYEVFLDQIQTMWHSQPNWTEADFKPINSSRVWIVDGDHEEAVRREQQDLMAAWLPNAGELLLPQVSHFAFIQDPETFNAMLLRFLRLPIYGKYLDQSTVITSPKRWLSLPPTPSLPNGVKGQYANVNGIKLWYAKFGKHQPKKSPVILLHGGLANSDYWGLQVRALQSDFEVITVDSRGHGRSTTDFSVPFGYDLMSSDFVALMDYLKIPKASFVGWSDGGINALNIASKHPDRVDKIFAFAANYVVSGVKDISQSVVFNTYINRTVFEYARLSPTPNQYNTFLTSIEGMWASQPTWDQSHFSPIPALRTWIVDADHEEAIYRDQPDTMASWLPDGGELILPQVSHFAFIQDPGTFTSAVVNFLNLD
ncbi:hypothetical protein FRB99_001584 [Tulasnella sp. 403]|nr:hypothetical protein FRB99_001584 [Tulasnella sp. 403]